MATNTNNMNVSTQEVNKFNQLSEYWWDPQGPLKTLHQIQPVRMFFIKEHCELINKKCVDVGCGGGILTEALATQSMDVTGIDMAQEVLNVAKMHSTGLKHPPQYHEMTAQTLAQTEPGSYDVVTCLELIEHVPSPQELIRDLSTLLKPGGDLFISTLNRTAKSYLMAILGAEYLLKWLPKGTHQYNTFIRPSELANQARPYGLDLVNLKGISYRPLMKDFVLSSDCSVNYIAHFTKSS